MRRRIELADGVLTFYFAPNQNLGAISYDVYGYLPGQYRALPTSIKSAYEPGRFHLGSASELRVRQAGEAGTDPYRATPDELFARGKAHFDAGRFCRRRAKASSRCSPATRFATRSPRTPLVCSC